MPTCPLHQRILPLHVVWGQRKHSLSTPSTARHSRGVCSFFLMQRGSLFIPVHRGDIHAHKGTRRRRSVRFPHGMICGFGIVVSHVAGWKLFGHYHPRYFLWRAISYAQGLCCGLCKSFSLFSCLGQTAVFPHSVIFVVDCICCYIWGLVQVSLTHRPIRVVFPWL